MDSWPFLDPKDLAVITTRRIVWEGFPVLLVCHDAEDGGWQFLDGQPISTADAAVVSLEEMVRRDPRLLELADLPPGWCASRTTPDAPWLRARSQPEE